jgi:UDP-2-acetamido-3-amino-2,3-dideoxy-glucuronate N-acetyltransferase
MPKLIAATASISQKANLSTGVSIWDFSQIRENVTVGENTIIGSYVYIDANVVIGKNCKIQSRALVYDPADVADGVFIGPGAILTNDQYPRAINSIGEIKSISDWSKVGVVVKAGASIGSGAICIAPISIGKCAMIGAGSVVTKDVQDYALVVGNPARQIGWVGRTGIRLIEISPNIFECPETQSRYQLQNNSLSEII